MHQKVIRWFLYTSLVVGIVYLIYGQPLRINDVQVVGNTHTVTAEYTGISAEYLQSHRFFIFPQDNLLFFPTKKFTKAILEGIPGVAEVQVDIDSHKDIQISVEDRKATGIWCNTAELTDCYFFDDTGVIFKRSFDFIGALFVRWHSPGATVGLGDTVICTPSCTDRAYIDRISAYKIHSVEYGVDTQVLRSVYSYFIKASNDATTTLRHLNMLESRNVDIQTLEYVDVRFPHKIYYK